MRTARSSQVASLLSDLVERHAVSGHEWSVRRAVLAALPAWARERAVVDDIGNITVEAGPQGDATVFMAHMDEVGYVIESIAPDGTVTLAAQGGAVASAWEGQTALVHFDPQGAPSTVTGQGDDIDARWKAQFACGYGAAAAPWRLPDSIRGTAEESRSDAGVVWPRRRRPGGARRRGGHAGDESQRGTAAGAHAVRGPIA